MAAILVIEDERPISRAIVDNLDLEGHTVMAAFDGTSGLEKAVSERPDLILLDIVMPGLNGYDVCRRLREAGNETPVIMLTAKGEEIDKVLGLELGADDYITKPVGVRELLARVNAVLRRSERAPQTDHEKVLVFGDARVDFESYETVVVALHAQ